MSAFIFAGGDPSKVDVSGYVKGDVLAADTTGTLQPVTVGPDGDVLTADSIASDGVDWQPGGGGGATPGNTVVTEQAFGQASTSGALLTYSRSDHTHGTPAAPTAASVGLGNVDNTSDANKPVSTAQQTALNLKANLASPTFTGTVTTAKSIKTPVVLTDAGTVAVDASLANYFRLTLTASGHTLGNPTNLTDGQMILFELIQSAGGGNTLTLDTKYSFGTGITSFTMTSTASKRDFLGVVYNLAADKLYVIALAQGY